MSGTSGNGGDDWPHVAWTGTEYGLVWRRHVGEGAAVYLARVSSGGALLGAPSLVAHHARGVRAPRVVWNGEAYAVAWIAAGGSDPVYLTILSASGERLAE